MDRATLRVYEEHAAEWRDRRQVRGPDRAAGLAQRLGDGRPRVDLGCGPGGHLPLLGRPVVGLDAAHAMLELARLEAPHAWLVQADLAALPFRARAIAGSWARASYLHLAKAELPAALADLHRALDVDAESMFDFRFGDAEGPLESDDFPGRFFAEWQAEELTAVLVGAGFAVTECRRSKSGEWLRVRSTRERTLPDYVGRGMRLLVCGLNPSLYAADVGVGYGRPGNRFWPAAIAAGLVTRDRDPRHALLHDHVGMTDLVKRATTGARLTRAEYRDGAARVERLVRWLRPRAVCFVGLTGWRAAVDAKAREGVQPEPFGDAPAYVMPNTSGINTRSTLDTLAQHLEAAAALAERGTAT